MGEKKGKWWDVEKKRDIKRKLRSWRERGGEELEYKRERWEYRKLCERKKGEENERIKR